MAEKDPFFVPTRSSMSGSHSYTCIVHKLSKPKITLDDDNPLPVPDKFNNEPTKVAESKLITKQDREKEMKKLRFDVYQFARSGLAAKDKFTADRELAVRLGAERPKRVEKNYIELKKEKEMRRKAIEESKINPMLSNSVPYDPYKTHFSILKKMRNDRKKGNIGGMLSDYGKPIVKNNKSSKRFKR